jgi:hypothetical protein
MQWCFACTGLQIIVPAVVIPVVMALLLGLLILRYNLLTARGTYVSLDVASSMRLAFLCCLLESQDYGQSFAFTLGMWHSVVLSQPCPCTVLNYTGLY